MSDAIGSAPAGDTRSDALVPGLFAVAIFTSAALVFTVQPMVTKLVLPMLGGSPSVWNTSMVFFQTALLVGYAYAHALQRIRSLKVQATVHVALLALAGLFLPLAVTPMFGDPDPSHPIGWLLGVLAVSVGAPFAVLSATAPLLQAWFARVRAGRADGANPYVLYAASNLGSFLALLAYPVVVEPLLGLTDQRLSWTGGYAVFAVLVIALAAVIWRRRADGGAATPPLERSAPLTWRERGVLILLAAAPSSLMLGVTNYLSTDVASAPFLWVAPLALYLLTFVIAFQSRPWIPLPITLVVQAAGAAVCLVVLPFNTTVDWAVVFALQLAVFFFTALMCHQQLAARRPAPDRLTEFFLLLSLGGVLGGAFNALIAPVIFRGVWEYPLVLVLVGLARGWSPRPVERSEVVMFVVALLVCAVPPMLSLWMEVDWDFAWQVINAVGQLDRPTVAILAVAAIIAFLLRDRAPAYVAILAAISLSAHYIGRGYDWNLVERSFFGVMRVATAQEPDMGGDVHVLMHGTTLHGAQARAPGHACAPTLYYATTTPIGQTMQRVQAEHPAAVVGVVGQGSGAMAAYVRPTDRMTFFEIDPMVDRMSRDPRWFSFINGCARAPVDTVMGDARLSLEREPAAKYDLLIVDAFSSDAVPTHLLTEEAIRDYLRVVKPQGVVLLHLSNRNLEITLPAVAAGHDLDAAMLHQLYGQNPSAPGMSEASTEALILSPSPMGLVGFASDGRWREPGPTEVRPWTDDYVNLFGSLMRALRD